MLLVQAFQYIGLPYGVAWFLSQAILILVLSVSLLVMLAFLLLMDRKVWAAVQLRRGPNVVGIFGLLQSFADFIKFATNEVVIPAGAASRLHSRSVRLGGGAGGTWLGDRRHQCRHSLSLRHLLARRLRHHHG